MNNARKKILETITFQKGLEIDIDEGYKKLIKSQFGSNPAKGFGELIQNLIDSYPADVPMEKRKGVITTFRNVISITDYGAGMDRQKLKLLLTLGGTDKDQDPSKIGMFGIGFFSIFNPVLGTRKVKVTTNCEGYMVELTFRIINQESTPEISTQLLRKRKRFQTRIEVWFNDKKSVEQCTKYAKKALLYYPCSIKIDGKPFKSEWHKAREEKNKIFKTDEVSGFVSKSGWRDQVRVLCKYEYILQLPVNSFPKGGRNLKGNLLDYYDTKTPYVPGYSCTINNNNLWVTISRDSFYLDKNFRKSVSLLNEMFMEKLKDLLENGVNKEVLLANQYIFKENIKEYLYNPYEYKEEKIKRSVIIRLAHAKVYEKSDSYEKYSLMDFSKMLSQHLPLFYAEKKTNVQWLGGNFEHNFIVLPNTCKAYHGAPDFYNELFNCVFEDTVDLDTIRTNSNKINELVARGIVEESSLSPDCSFVGEQSLNKNQEGLLDDINNILEHQEVKRVIAETINIPLNTIRPSFFVVKDDGAYISAGLFDETGEPLSGQFVTNFKEEEEEYRGINTRKPVDIVLGIGLDHPIIQYLLANNSEYRSYYALTYIAHELALCQKLLVPYSPLYHLVKEKTASGMRKALIDQLINTHAA